MILSPAQPSDAQEIADLVNSAYRGDSSRFGWTTEADFLDGSRIRAEAARAMIEPDFGRIILVLREAAPILACVYLEKFADEDLQGCYLGMLTVNPKMQDRGLGRLVLNGAEAFAKQWGCKRMSLSVIQLRGTLMAWYERRGYRRTDVVKPFPYDQPEAGIPKRQDLHFVMFEKDLT